MSYYRLYFLNAENRISRFLELFHDCDDQAIDTARSHGAGQSVELWNRNRFVARLQADGSVRREPAGQPPLA